MIVIPQNGPDALGRIQLRQRFRARLDKTPVGSRVIARQNKHVRLCLLGQRNHAADIIDAENAAVMNVGELSDTKAFEARRKIANEDVGFRNPVVIGLDETRVS